MYGRMGSLFIKNFKRQPIEDKQHFLNAIVYTHRNPIHHRFRKDFHEWEFSSYNEIMAELNSITQSTKLLKMVGGIDEFINIHLENLQNNYFDDFE
jgi:putative transposase